MMTCDFKACKTCSRCWHNAHDQCQQVVKCPDDKRERPCQCCGKGAK